MSFWARIFIWSWLFLAAGAWSVAAATKAEEKAFQEATSAYHGRNWARAERELGAFVAKFPESEFRAEAILFQAESRKELGDFTGAIQLLEAGRESAGRFADEYLFWLAEAQFQGGQLSAAADSYARFVTEFANSTRVLDATVAEAAARSQLKEWPRVVALLSDPAGRFQTLAGASPGLDASVRGRFLLAEAFMAQRQFEAAASALDPLVSQPLDNRLAWQRDYLRAQIFLKQDLPEPALNLATNLTALAGNVVALRAEGTALQARIHEQLRQPEAAIAAWRLNLETGIPPERQREALLRVGDLLIHQDRLPEATRTLETFMATGTNAAAADVIQLTLGQLRLRQSILTNGPPATNLLAGALEAFNRVLRDYPDTGLSGQAHLGRGWCLWLNNQVKDGAAAFAAATRALPAGYDRSIARFKLADAQAQQGNFAEALSSYQQVVSDGANDSLVRSNLVERSLYQVLKAAREARDDPAANAAMARLLEEYPGGSLIEPALILYGRQSESLANPVERRAVLEGFLERSPKSKLAAGVRLAVARTFEQEQDWTAAAQIYKSWLADHPDDPARTRAEYLLALATWHKGDEGAALNLMTNYVADFPNTEFTPLARWWTADHYMRQKDFINAEANYQLVFKQHPESGLRFDAQLMAGRAATGRDALREAISYFTNLANDVNCPPGIEAQAFFAYGDAKMSSADYDTAIKLFSKVVQLFPNDRIALLAQVKMGNCYLQLGGLNPTNAANIYNNASRAYQEVLNSTNQTEFADRAEAEVGLGLVFERQSKLVSGTNTTVYLRRALDHYLNVVYGRTRNVDEPGDMFWVKTAGLDHALPLSESMQAWDQAARLCDTLAAQLPSLQPQLEKRRTRAEEQSRKTPL
jgi:TolA-binding protein